MNPMASASKKTVLALLCLAGSGSNPTVADAAETVPDYWRRHWAWYDESYRPYFHRRFQYGTPTGGGSYHADPDLHDSRITPLGGGSYHADPSLKSPTSTPIGGGSYHAPRSPYDRRLRGPGPADTPSRHAYGWW